MSKVFDLVQDYPIRPLVASDIMEINSCAYDMNLDLGGMSREQVAQMAERFGGHTLLTPDNEIVLCAGIVPLSAGTGEGWLWTDERIEQSHANKRAALVALRTGIAFAFKKSGYHRIQIHVSSLYAGSVKFMSRLGFHLEGVAKAYGPDKVDFYTMAKVVR